MSVKIKEPLVAFQYWAEKKRKEARERRNDWDASKVICTASESMLSLRVTDNAATVAHQVSDLLKDESQYELWAAIWGCITPDHYPEVRELIVGLTCMVAASWNKRVVPVVISFAYRVFWCLHAPLAVDCQHRRSLARDLLDGCQQCLIFT